MSCRARQLIVVILALVTAAASVMMLEAWQVRQDAPQAIEFQRLTGGIGLGAETNLSRCPMAMDPRVDGQCTHTTGPCPGGSSLCACHAFSVMFVEPTRAEVLLHFKGRTNVGDH